MFIILDRKNTILDIKAHEEMVSDDVKIYENTVTKKWAVEVSGKFKHPYPTVKKLEGEGWVCL
jgi:hypothetical protein